MRPACFRWKSELRDNVESGDSVRRNGRLLPLPPPLPLLLLLASAEQVTSADSEGHIELLDEKSKRQSGRVYLRGGRGSE
jgi:hypothetical protein